MERAKLKEAMGDGLELLSNVVEITFQHWRFSGWHANQLTCLLPLDETIFERAS